MVDPRLLAQTRMALLQGNVNERLLDRAIRHGLYLIRLSGQEAGMIVKFLEKEVFPDILRRLRLLEGIRGSAASIDATKRLRKLAESIDGIIRTGLLEAQGRFVEQMKGLAMSEARFQQALIEKVSPVPIEFTVPNPRLLHSATVSRPMQGKHLKDWYGDLDRRLRGEVRRQINIGLAQGETMDQITRRVRGTPAVGGSFTQTEHGIRAITRTAVNHVSNHARQATYEANSDVVWGYQFVATLDASTTFTCIALDGSKWELGRAGGRTPPMHIGCRSTTVPILRSWKQLGINLKEPPPSSRAARIGMKPEEIAKDLGGQVPGKVKYLDWLRVQKASTQDQVLGRGLGKLFRQGKITDPKQLVNLEGKPLSMTQIFRREGLAVPV